MEIKNKILCESKIENLIFSIRFQAVSLFSTARLATKSFNSWSVINILVKGFEFLL
jgi:hypothetical protein